MKNNNDNFDDNISLGNDNNAKSCSTRHIFNYVFMKHMI